MKPQRRSEKCAIVNRTVSFNIDDPYQAQLLERSHQMTNFSAAVKRWLAGEGQNFTMMPVVPSVKSKEREIEVIQEPFDPVSALF